MPRNKPPSIQETESEFDMLHAEFLLEPPQTRLMAMRAWRHLVRRHESLTEIESALEEGGIEGLSEGEVARMMLAEANSPDQRPNARMRALVQLSRMKKDNTKDRLDRVTADLREKNLELKRLTRELREAREDVEMLRKENAALLISPPKPAASSDFAKGEGTDRNGLNQLFGRDA